MENDNIQKQEIRLEVNRPEDDEREIDLIEVAKAIASKRRIYAYLLVIAVLVGLLLGGLSVVYDHYFNEASYVRGLISFNYKGIEKGLDPNGAVFDVTVLKSPAVLEPALAAIGRDSAYLSHLKDNIDIKAVQPQDVVERITIIERMSEKDPSNYEKLLDVDYYPSQYVVYLYDDGTFSTREMSNLLNAVFDSYREYFYKTYADSDVITVVANLLDSGDYDYSANIDLISTQIDLMESFVEAKQAEAPEFRSSATGMSFEDIGASLELIKTIDLANISSFVQTHTLSNDPMQMVEYYEYLITETRRQLNEQQVKLANVTEAINNYEKDPMVVVSGQDSTAQFTTTSEYYDTLVAEKISISNRIASINVRLSKYNELKNSFSERQSEIYSEEFDYADVKIANIKTKISNMIDLLEVTTDEYYRTSKYTDAFQVSVPAQYVAAGGLGHMAKKAMMPVAVMVLLVIFLWAGDGFLTELKRSQSGK